MLVNFKQDNSPQHFVYSAIMQKQRRINIDFNNARSRFSQRTNEATLVVGRKNGDDMSNSDSYMKESTNSLRIKNNDEKSIKSSHLLNFGKRNEIKGNVPKSQGKLDTSPSNSEINNSSGTFKPVTLTVKFHESRTSPDTVLVDSKLVPGAKVGDVGEVQCPFGSKKKFFFKFKEFKKESTGTGYDSKSIGVEKLASNDNESTTHDLANANGNTGTLTSNGLNTTESRTDPDFVPPSNLDNTAAHNLESTNSTSGIISILSGPIVTTLDLKPRSQVLVRVRAKELVQADTIEIYVKDIHLSRGDMWNISNAIVDKCVHKNERLSFINGSIRLSVSKIYKNGHKFFSSYIGKDTKVVFRSDSARLIVFIQISSEMWHFEESGQQMFHKLVNSFFPKAFQKWKDLGTHHLITIILFSSVDLAGEKIRYLEGETPPDKTDYYRVVVDQVHILLWNEIMATLRLEFANFKRDIYLHKNKHRDESHPQEYLIQGSILPSAKGSVLEAINLGMSLVCDDFKDSYLRQTTNHFIMISPGTGLFDVSYDMLIRTSKLMTTVDSTVDIICLSQPPLHIVPLVRYLDNQNRLKHCIPNWLDISFWSDSSQAVHQWLPKCKIYELQMMGVMENELSTVTINDLDLSNYRSAVEAMESYDQDVFVRTKKDRKAASKVEKSMAYNRLNENAKNRTIAITNHQNSMSAGIVDDVLTPSELIITQNKSSPATCNAVGISTTSKSNVSAFSSLLSLSKNTDVKTPTFTAYNFVKKMISTPILKPSLSDAETKSLDTDNKGSSDDLQTIDPLTLSSSSYISSELDNSGKCPSNSARSSTSSAVTINRSSSSIGQLSNPKIMLESKKFARNKRSSKSPKKANKESARSRYLEERDSILNSYWTNIENPSNTLTAELLGKISYGRWRFVFPPNVRRRAVKWISLSSPASLPILTTIFPTLTDFNQNYTFRIYDVLLNQDIVNENQTSETLMQSMISLRLSLGFQICIGEKVEKVEKHRKPNGDSRMLIQFMNPGKFIGSRVYLSLGNEIHRICCDFNSLINVQVYKRITSTDEQLTLSNDKKYVEYIRTRYAEVYSPVTITNSTNENLRNYNWNQLDQVLAGYDESIDKQKYHRMKFVVLPATVPENAFSLTNEKLTTEEIRLEGIRSLIMNIYKTRFRTNEEKKLNKRQEISPEIYFYTGRLFDYLRNESNSLKKLYNTNSFIPDSILTSSNKGSFSKGQQFDKSIDPYKLVAILQSHEGIPIIDRHWHLKFYRNCFLGMDLVDFLVEHFEDIETREEAVDYGNKLMSEKVFSHVVSTHNFLDGHYFYYLGKKFTENAAKLTKVDKESGSIEKDAKQEDGNRRRSTTAPDYRSQDPHNKAGDTNGELRQNKTVMLSKEVLCDLDPSGYSWQPEQIKVHYDIVHNPDHCFHLRIEWLNTTSKLIEDLINGWSKYCERYGLSLVEIPWEELFTLPIRNPLHSTIEISLALNPWEDEEFRGLEKIYKKEKYYFHLYLLRKSSFMLDNRTANYFKNDDFDVVYSWGKPMFKYAQFIHSTGGYIAELRNNGDFFLAPNNAHISRLNLNIGKLHNLGKSKAIYFDSQSVMLEFRSICTSKDKLRDIFREGVRSFEKDEGCEDFV